MNTTTQMPSRRPLYQQLMQTVRARIENGTLKPGELAPSESDLIAEFRVSSTTARRCLNELATVGLVQRVQGRGTYVSPTAALPVCRHIGVLHHDLVDLSDTFSAGALRGMNTALGQSSEGAYEPLLLHLRQVRRSEDHAAALAALAQRHNLDALLLLSPVPPAWLTNLPAASVNFSYDDDRIVSATCDHSGAFNRLAKRLTAMGHRRVVALRGKFDQQLVDGVHMTLASSDLVPDEWINEEHAYFDAADMQRVVERHLASKDRPTAFLCFGYDIAMAVAAMVRSRGYSIPGDVSIAFLGVPSPHTHFSGEIIPIEAMAQYAVMQLVNRVEGRPLAGEQQFTSITHEGGTLAPASL